MVLETFMTQGIARATPKSAPRHLEQQGTAGESWAFVAHPSGRYEQWQSTNGGASTQKSVIGWKSLIEKISVRT